MKGRIGLKNVAQLVQLTTNSPHCFSGTLCLFDGADAFIRSGGGENVVDLFSRLNYVAWARFVGLGIRELATAIAWRETSRLSRRPEKPLPHIPKTQGAGY